MKTIKNTIAFGAVLAVIFAFNFKIQTEEWIVPDKYLNMQNPTDAEEDLDIGEEL